MESKTVVSIISIFYNREESVEKSVESLINQTYKNIGIFLIDDNSKDSTYSKLKEYEKLDNRVNVIKNEQNTGFTKTLINVINQLDSKYIAIHGSGDVSLPKRIETQVAFLEENANVGVVAVGVKNRPVNNISKTIQEITLKKLLKRNMLNHGATMFRHDKYVEVGGYREYFKYRQDKDLWYRLSMVTKIYFLPEKLYQWTEQEKSVTKNTTINFEPTLLSEFSTFLIEERISLGYDSLDKFGEKAALLFNPERCKHIFYKNIKSYGRRKEWGSILITLKMLIKVSSNRFLVLFYKIIIQFLSKLKLK